MGKLWHCVWQYWLLLHRSKVPFNNIIFARKGKIFVTWLAVHLYIEQVCSFYQTGFNFTFHNIVSGPLPHLLCVKSSLIFDIIPLTSTDYSVSDYCKGSTPPPPIKISLFSSFASNSIFEAQEFQDITNYPQKVGKLHAKKSRYKKVHEHDQVGHLAF